AGRSTGATKGRDPGSSGPGRGAGSAGTRLRGRQRRPRRAADRTRGRGPRQAPRDVRAATDEPADRGVRDSAMKFGVIRFPGSCDEVDAVQAAERVAEATLLWHGDRDLQGVHV